MEGSDVHAPKVFETLCRKYTESGRRYHTPAHIDHCLRQLDLAADHMDERDAVEMALWFHDAIYDLGSQHSENERNSADLFVSLVGAHVSPRFRERVYELIMITTHRNLPRSRDECFIVDIDLSGFGLPWEDFTRDSIAVKDEQRHLSDDVFFSRQRKFFETLLSREHFCFTEFFRERHEQNARKNIQRCLRTLEKKAVS